MGGERYTLLNEEATNPDAPLAHPNPDLSSNPNSNSNPLPLPLPPAGYAIYPPPPPSGYPMMYPVQGGEPQMVMMNHPAGYPNLHLQHPQPYYYPPQFVSPQCEQLQTDNKQNDSVLQVVGDTSSDSLVVETFGVQCMKLPGRVLASTKPYLNNYNELKTYASWKTITLVLFLQLVFRGFLNPFLFTHLPINPISLVTMVGYIYWGFIVSFLLVNGILHGVCMCFGGGRSAGRPSSTLYTQLCFICVLFSPLLDMLILVTLIPVVGTACALFFVAYLITLNAMAVRSVYNFSARKACAIVVTLVICTALIYFPLVFNIFWHGENPFTYDDEY